MIDRNDVRWYRDAVIYQLHVKSFFDSDNDGIGDFRGLTQKLDYVKDLGATAIWLMPFYPSPLRDDGYDIANYRDINPAYGRCATSRRLCAPRMSEAFASSPNSSSTTPPTSIPGSSARGRPSPARRRAISTSGPTTTAATGTSPSSSATSKSRTGP